MQAGFFASAQNLEHFLPTVDLWVMSHGQGCFKGKGTAVPDGYECFPK